jgi:hypothetical protein
MNEPAGQWRSHERTNIAAARGGAEKKYFAWIAAKSKDVAL